MEEKRRKVRKVRVTNVDYTTSLDPSPNKKPLKINTIVVAAVILLVVLINAHYIYKHAIKGRDKSPQKELDVRVFGKFKEPEEEITPESAFLSAGDEARAELLARNFLTSKSAEDASYFIHDSEDGGELFSQYFQPTPEVTELRKISSYQYRDGSRSAFFLVYAAGNRKEIHAYALPRKPFKIDWKSYYLLSEQTLYDYVETLPKEEVEVIGYLSTQSYYTPDFPEHKYVSYQLSDFSGETKVYIYTEPGSDQRTEIAEAIALSPLKSQGQKIIRVSLKLKGMKKEPVPTAEIIEVLATDWVAPIQRSIEGGSQVVPVGEDSESPGNEAEEQLEEESEPEETQDTGSEE